MLFHERLYQLHIILGDKNQPALWEAKGWQFIRANLSKVTKAARGPASLNSLQYIPALGNKYLDGKFGKLGLSEKAEKKWLHDYVNFPERKDWLFHSVELWAPGRTTCGNQNLAPDVYLGIANEGYYSNPAAVIFNPYLVLAGAVDMGEEYLSDVNNLATVICQHTKAILHIHKTIPWGKSNLSSGFTDAIGDLLADVTHGVDRVDGTWLSGPRYRVGL